MINPISLYDYLIIIIYFIVVLGIGLSFRNRDKNLTDYFLAGRNLGWFTIGISMFATNISSEHFIGLAGQGEARGLAVAQFELIAIFLLILLGWIIAPIYKKTGILTTPEFLEKRFNTAARKLFSGLSIATYIVTKILVTLFASGILFNKILGLNIFSSAVIIVFLTGIYSLVGGFSAVIRTQILQGILLILGAVLLTIFSLNEVGGFSGLTAKLPAEHFQMLKPFTDPDFPWTGIIFGAPIIAFWYWCADYYMVQRILGSKSINDAQTGTILTSILKILPIFILVLPGLIAFALFPEIRGDEAYPVLLASDILPNGIKGLVIVGFLSAVMSSLSASFNSIAALYTIDFYKPKHPNASDRTLVLVGRMATIITIFVVILLIPFVKIVNSHIYIFLQSTQAFVSAPIAAVFIFGLTFKKVTAKSAVISLIVGESLGALRFIIEFLNKSELLSNSFLIYYAQINYLHFTIFLFFVTSIMLFAFSYIFASKPDSNRQNVGLYYSENYYFDIQTEGISDFSRSKYKFILTFGVLILTLSLWYFFV